MRIRSCPALMLAVALTSALSACGRQGPRRTVADAASTLAGASWPGFTERVDVDSVVSAYGRAITRSVDLSTSKLSDTDLLALAYGPELSDPAAFAAHVRDALRTAVASRHLDPLAFLPGRMHDMRGLSIRATDTVETRGDVALVKFRVTASAPKLDGTFALRLVRAKGGWHIVGFDRLDHVLSIGVDSIAQRSAVRDGIIGDLKNLANQEFIHYVDDNTFSRDPAVLGFRSDWGYTTKVLRADKLGWSAQAWQTGDPGLGCAVYYGGPSRVPVRTPGGKVAARPGVTACDF